MQRVHTFRFKRRSDVLNFAYKHPGGLAAHFLQQVRLRSLRPLAQDTRELAETDASAWAAALQDLKDVRDQKEVAFLTKAFADLSQGRLAALADLLAMRIREIRTAKTAGGSWDKAAVVSLLPQSLPSNTPVPDAALAL
eukprot:11192296-Lingulodinium_polyedra.AAC.1